jgi:sialic acid synthase SpsE/mannose-6-phosphate isomerase-like protein (cupin superfamily)
MNNRKKPLIIFEMANNHMGSVEHGKKIINSLKEESKDFDFEFAIKFQYRDLDSFIHPDYKNRMDLKFVKRFSETKISDADYLSLKSECEKVGFKTVCTPFDEVSARKIKEQNYDYLKVASCSIKDWPLLDQICKLDMPVIASTGGASLVDVDKVVSLFHHENVKLILMHCVGIYPTQNSNLQLNRIDWFKNRYSEIEVGFSTHESPDQLLPASIAVGKGVMIFEKHVGLEDKSKKFGLNAYSANPKQVRKWLDCINQSIEILGEISEQNYIPREEEITGLLDLKRGAYAKKTIEKDSEFDKDNVFYAMPVQKSQMTSEDFSKHNLKYVSLDNYNINEPITNFSIEESNESNVAISNILHKVKGLLNQARIVVNNESNIELSHHYGIENLSNTGAVLIDCINQEYCKKILVMIPNQVHPEHYHIKKKESFQILWGDLELKLNSVKMQLKAGDIVTVDKMEKHSFSTQNGVVFEEVSTTAFSNDSVYTDEKINKIKNRKTSLRDHWGRNF